MKKKKNRNKKTEIIKKTDLETETKKTEIRKKRKK